MEPMTVSEVSRLVKSTLRSQPELRDIAVWGEVTNYADRGHHYFSIKDDSSILKCIIWKNNSCSMDCLPLENGAKVVVWGSIGTYPVGSTYQLDVSRCLLEGRGDLYRQYLELKRRLLGEGLFDAGHKKSIPGFPGSIGIITSEKGAALQDMVKVLMSGPGVSIFIFDARVQGGGSAASISQGIRTLDGKVDVIIIGRGGGSIEDMWAFNDEGLARAVYGCGTPIISAVGHEVDEVITDHVADYRASTPTAAAEFLVRAMQNKVERKCRLEADMRRAIANRVNTSRQLLDGYDMPLRRKLLASRIIMSRKSLVALHTGMSHAMTGNLSRAKMSRSTLDSVLRQTWVAAMAENGLAALYQDGTRVKDIRAFRKGMFKGLVRNGKISGEVKEIEIRGDNG